MKRPPPDPDSSKAAYLRALRWLGARELSEGAIRERLTRIGYTRAAIDPAVTRLLDDRTLDDRRTATSVARACALRHGPRRIFGKLVAMRIDRDLAQEVVRELLAEEDEGTLLERALDRRLRGDATRLKDPGERRRVLAHLVRQGFSAAAASHLIRAKSK